MSNPYKQLKKEQKVEKVIAEGFEEIEGQLRCQTLNCGETVTTGLYSKTARVLTWKCSKRHVSRMENFDF